jgi:hypothetical protein
MDAAAEFAVGINPQMFALAIVAAFGACGATGLDDAAGQFTRLFEFIEIETHSTSSGNSRPSARTTFFQPRFDFLPSRSMQ